jgi:hypothetical protein
MWGTIIGVVVDVIVSAVAPIRKRKPRKPRS